MSHLFAERRFTLTLSRTYLNRTLRFGAPLALNGLLLLATFHGEKLLVGHVMGPTSLAILAMGFTLTLTPALILGRSLQAYFLPQAPLLPLLPALAVLHAIRVFKTGIAIVALAQDDTINTAIGNLPRLAALPIIYLQLISGTPLSGIIWIAACAEAAGCAAASYRLYIRQKAR